MAFPAFLQPSEVKEGHSAEPLFGSQVIPNVKTGHPFMAEAALEVGLVNRVLPPTETAAYAHSVARKLAQKPMASLIETKRLMKQAQMPAVLETIGREANSFAQLLRAPAAKEAFSAFMERRKPNFSGL